jgi:hypothetical protein
MVTVCNGEGEGEPENGSIKTYTLYFIMQNMRIPQKIVCVCLWQGQRLKVKLNIDNSRSSKDERWERELPVE